MTWCLVSPWCFVLCGFSLCQDYEKEEEIKQKSMLTGKWGGNTLLVSHDAFKTPKVIVARPA